LVFINLVGLMVHFVVFCSSANLLSKTEQQWGDFRTNNRYLRFNFSINLF
jgi:hypothetical protein